MNIVDARQACHADKLSRLQQANRTADFLAPTREVVVVPSLVDVDPDEPAGCGNPVGDRRIASPSVDGRNVPAADFTQRNHGNTCRSASATRSMSSDP